MNFVVHWYCKHLYLYRENKRYVIFSRIFLEMSDELKIFFQL